MATGRHLQGGVQQATHFLLGVQVRSGSTRLGLRAHEIIALQLEDCDWDGGHLCVRSKCGREQLLPMPVDVGAAIAAYFLWSIRVNSSTGRIYWHKRGSEGF
jgi:site-specific recombinase XerC